MSHGPEDRGTTVSRLSGAMRTGSCGQGGRAGDPVALGGESPGEVWRLDEPPGLRWIQAPTLLCCLMVLGVPDLGATPQAPVTAGDPRPRLWSC